MGSIAPPVYLAPPAVEPQRYNLFSIANMPDPTGRWELGVEWEPIAGERAELRAHECVDEYTSDVPLREGETTVEGIPFIVVGSYVCKSASRSIEDAEARAISHLNAGESRAVEFAIATGQMGNAPSFQGATDVTPTPGTAVSVEDGLGLLESDLGSDYGSTAAIHAPRLLAPAIGGGQYAWRQGQRLETLVGTLVAIGGGYDLANVGPDGSTPAAGTAWLYGTGRPTIRQGDVWVQPDQDHYLKQDDNDVAIMAQRTYLVTWEGPTVAVLVDAPGD